METIHLKSLGRLREKHRNAIYAVLNRRTVFGKRSENQAPLAALLDRTATDDVVFLLPNLLIDPESDSGDLVNMYFKGRNAYRVRTFLDQPDPAMIAEVEKGTKYLKLVNQEMIDTLQKHGRELFNDEKSALLIAMRGTHIFYPPIYLVGSYFKGKYFEGLRQDFQNSRDFRNIKFISPPGFVDLCANSRPVPERDLAQRVSSAMEW